MNKNLRNIYLLFCTLIILVVVGFFILIQKVNLLEKSLVNEQKAQKENSFSTSSLEGVDLLEEKESTGFQDQISNGSEEKSQETLEVKTLNSNILFNVLATDISTNSSIKLPVLINKFVKEPTGILNISVKVFTDQVSTTTSLEISDFIQIFREKGENIKANRITGAFKRIPPQSSADGVLSFIINPSLERIVIQVGYPDEMDFYELDFINNSYKEITVG